MGNLDNQIAASGIARRTLTINGRKYKLSPMSFGSLAEIKARVFAIRDPLVLAGRAAQHVPASQLSVYWGEAQKASLEAAKNQPVTLDEVKAFQQTPEGAAFMLWLLLRKEHGDEFPDESAAMRLIDEWGQERLEELIANVESASGEGDLGNSSGRTASPATTPGASTDSSPRSSDGTATT